MFEITRESALNAAHFANDYLMGHRSLGQDIMGMNVSKRTPGRRTNQPGPTQHATQQNATPTMNGSRNSQGVVVQASRNIAPEGRPGHITEAMMVQQNRPFTAGGKKMGWAQKNGQWVPVEWGSVAGVKLDNVDHPAYFNSVQQG